MKSSGKSDRFAEYQKQLRMAMRTLFPARGLSLTSDDGRVRWVDRYLVVAAVLLAWSAADRLHEAFAQARVLRVVRDAMRHPRRRAGSRCLARDLRAARRDPYVRTGPKTARDSPHKKREQPPGAPRVRMATKAEVAQAKEIKLKYEAAWFSASGGTLIRDWNAVVRCPDGISRRKRAWPR